MACQSGRTSGRRDRGPISAKRSLVRRSLRFWAPGGRPAVRLRKTTWYRGSRRPIWGRADPVASPLTTGRRNARQGVGRGGATPSV